MSSPDEDLFIISDDEMSVSSPPLRPLLNPVEKYLTNELIKVQDKFERATNDIDEMKEITEHILNILQQRALHGENINLDAIDMYTAEGEPIIKKKEDYKSYTKEQNLKVISYWQCILHDKWIIGIEMQNNLQCTLSKLKYYLYLKNEPVVHGESMFWQLGTNNFWQRIDATRFGTSHVVATAVLDLPEFAVESVVDCWGTISYEINETQFQTPVPLIQLSTAEIIDCSCIKLQEKDGNYAILAVKSVSSVEKIVEVRLLDDRADGEFEDDSVMKKLFFQGFLATNTFEKLQNCGDVFLVNVSNNPLTYCLIEVLSIEFVKARLRIFARSISQLHIILHLLKDAFFGTEVIEKADNCVEAAEALIRELELIRDKKSTFDIQKAKLITDLLIP